MNAPTTTAISRRHLIAAMTGAALPTTPVFAASPRVLLANLYDERIDPAPYLVSEKFDGARGVWDGRVLRFRSGRPVPAPAWFTDRLPKVPLDGELWLDRGRFDELSGIVRKDPGRDDEWRAVRYMVFELPGAGGPFAERARRLRELVSQTAWPPLQAVEHRAVADRAELRRRLAETVAAGGEGLVLHLASATYATGRGDVLLKLKPMRDSEATVIAHQGGHGKYEGMLGALRVRAADGRSFLIGTGFNDAQRREPPAIGSVVTFRYRDLTSTGLPRFASFLRVHPGV